MSLTKGTWSVHANGYRGQLEIATIGPQGEVTGTVYGDKLDGFWDEDSKKITFIRIPGSGNPVAIQTYSGYLFDEGDGSSATTEFLAGSFEAFSGTGATAQRTTYGWFAETSVIG